MQTIKGADPPRRSAGGRPKLRPAGRAAALHGHAVLRNGPREEEAARRRGHSRWWSICCERFEPHQIYAAGDLSDPHGTHRVCLNAVLTACHRCENDDWFADCEVWLYRGAWHEWGPHEIEMAVPLSPAEVDRKRTAIFKHQSQKDRALFPGPDMREFWKRAEDRNRDTATLYDKLGLAEYEAIEGFVRSQPGRRVMW